MLSPLSFATSGRRAELACAKERAGQEQTHHNRMQQHGREGFHTYLTRQVVIRDGLNRFYAPLVAHAMPFTITFSLDYEKLTFSRNETSVQNRTSR